MSCSTSPGLTDSLPEPTWLSGPHGALAFHAVLADRPWLHVVISHGFGEHSGWWFHVARELQRQGVSAYVFDHYHHGRSAGSTADVTDYAHLVDGLRTVLAQGVAPHAQGAPLLLLAHSNGALVSVLALEAPELAAVRAVALCSPFLGMRLPSLLSGTLVSTALRWLEPRARLPLAVRPWRVTGMRALWPQYFRDKLRFRSFTVRFFLAMRRALGRVDRVTSVGERPLLLLSAGREQVVNPSAMMRWYEGVRAASKTHRAYPTLHHELFNEAVWCDVLADVLAWARAELASGPPGSAAAHAGV